MDDNNVFKTLLSGSFNQDWVSVNWCASRRDLPATLTNRIDAFWQKQIIAAQKDGFIFNGDLCRLNFWHVQENRVVLGLGLTSYKELLHSNHCADELETAFGNEFLARALGISVVLVSADDQIILIRRSDKVGEFPNRTDLIGGHIHPREHAVSGVPDPFLAIIDEITEELNLEIGSAERLDCIGLIETTATRKPELVFELRSERQKSDILKTASRHRCPEIAEIFTVVNEAHALRNFLTTRRDEMSPSAYGGLCLYSLHLEGQHS
ncbi:MAG: NUDIX hydrolase [bacterium]